jgi:hypothetical protein
LRLLYASLCEFNARIINQSVEIPKSSLSQLKCSETEQNAGNCGPARIVRRRGGFQEPEEDQAVNRLAQALLTFHMRRAAHHEQKENHSGERQANEGRGAPCVR